MVEHVIRRTANVLARLASSEKRVTKNVLPINMEQIARTNATVKMGPRVIQSTVDVTAPQDGQESSATNRAALEVMVRCASISAHV